MPTVLENTILNLNEAIEEKLTLPEIELAIKCLETSRRLHIKGKEVVYETRKWLYITALPLMWALTIWVFLKKIVWVKFLGRKLQTNTFWFDGLSPICRRIKEGAASWRALDLIYNYRIYRKNLKGIYRIVSDFWVNIINAQAVRNRKSLVAKRLSVLIKEAYQRNGESEVRIFSVASGSAQAVLESIEKSRVPVKVCLLDLDQSALDYSRTLAQRMGLGNLISLTVIRGTATNHEKEIKDFNPHIIEMVGFMDYRPHKKAVQLVQKIFRSLPTDGYLLTANMCPDKERWFMKWVINWPMIYRNPSELHKILEAGGFQDTQIILEPQGLHAVAVCRKKRG